MVALRQARDTFPPNSKEYKALDQEVKEAELEYYRARNNEDLLTGLSPTDR